MSVRETIARAIAGHFGPEYDLMFHDKRDWMKHQGQHPSGYTCDVNGPFQSCCDDAADAALTALEAKGLKIVGREIEFPVIDGIVTHEIRGPAPDVWRMLFDAAPKPTEMDDE